MEEERSGDNKLEINVRDDSKIVEVWLTGQERQDQILEKKLKLLYQQCKAKKYLAAVFLSGPRDLAEETGALLRYNKRRLAELEVKREPNRNRAQ